MSLKSFYDGLYKYEQSTDLETIEILARCVLRNLTREELRDMVRGQAYERVLDVGCGIGFNLIVLLTYANVTNVIGADVAPGAVKIAKRRLRRRGMNARADFLVCDAQSLPFRKTFFDLVICTEVLEHIPNDVKAVSEISRVTMGDGKVFLSVPSARNTFAGYLFKKKTGIALRNRQTTRSAYFGLQTGGDLRSYDIEDFARLLNAESIKMIRHWHNGRFFYSLSARLNLVILSLAERLPAAGDFGGDTVRESAGAIESSPRFDKLLNLYRRTILPLSNVILSLDLAVLRFDYGGNLTMEAEREV